MILLVLCCLFPCSGGELVLLHVKLVPEVFLEFLLGTSGHLLSFEASEDGLSGFLCLILGLLDLVKTLLLLLGVLTNHLVFEGLHLLLTLEEGALLVHGENHVSLRLLHFEVLDTGHFAVFRNHTLNDGVDLVLLFKVFLVGFGLQLLAVNNLVLDSGLVGQTVLFAGLFGLTLDLVLDFLGAQHDLIDLSVLLLQSKN